MGSLENIFGSLFSGQRGIFIVLGAVLFAMQGSRHDMAQNAAIGGAVGFGAGFAAEQTGLMSKLQESWNQLTSGLDTGGNSGNGGNGNGGG